MRSVHSDRGAYKIFLHPERNRVRVRLIVGAMQFKVWELPLKGERWRFWKIYAGAGFTGAEVDDPEPECVASILLEGFSRLERNVKPSPFAAGIGVSVDVRVPSAAGASRSDDCLTLSPHAEVAVARINVVTPTLRRALSRKNIVYPPCSKLFGRSRKKLDGKRQKIQ